MCDFAPKIQQLKREDSTAFIPALIALFPLMYQYLHNYNGSSILKVRIHVS